MNRKEKLEYLRVQSKQRFDKIRNTWIELGGWAAPWRIKWLLSQTEGERNNRHIVDTTHITALRSYTAGFMEGNTSSSRPWYRTGTGEMEVDMFPEHHDWLDKFNAATYRNFSKSNFYHSVGQFYYDYGVFNTGAYYIEEVPSIGLFYHNLEPGSFYSLNNSYGDAVVLVREFQLTVKALVEGYGRKVDGSADWSNISSEVRKMYEDGIYTQYVGVVQVVQRNEDFDPNLPVGGKNRQWVSYTYETGQGKGEYIYEVSNSLSSSFSVGNEGLFLKVSYSKYKPFLVGKSASGNNYEYGETGPTLDALGAIKSLQKKAIAKDQALEHILRPAMQGPSTLKKSYVTTSPNSFVPLDAFSNQGKGMRPIFEINPAVGALTGDVQDLRSQVEKLYYADYLLYLSRNPKTRTAAETHAVVQEQQTFIGPNLQSLNWTHNTPIVEHMMEWTLDNDPSVPPLPEGLQGRFIKPEFISVFAQAQRAADLPVIDRYMAMISQVASINPSILDKANLDRIADLYEDRLYLPAGINRPQNEVDARREQAQMMMQRQQELEAAMSTASAAKDASVAINNMGNNE